MVERSLVRGSERSRYQRAETCPERDWPHRIDFQVLLGRVSGIPVERGRPQEGLSYHGQTVVMTMEKLLNYPCSCGGKLKRSFCHVEFFGIDFGERPCEVCTSCGSEFLEDNTLKDIEEEVKKKSLFGLEEQVRVVKSGNSLVLRIPPGIARFTGVKVNASARMHPVDKKRIEVEII